MHRFPKLRATRRIYLGFTLAELLISLAILGVIATFTIPKILSTQQNNSYNAIAKEAIGMISEAYQQHTMNGQLSANTYGYDLSQYMNYVSVLTSGTIDDRPTGTSMTCNVAYPCLKLHNGAILQILPEYFGGTATTNYVSFTLDPDGVYTGKADSLRILIYYNGRLLDRNNCLPNSQSSVTGAIINPITNGNPNWFSWN